MQRFFDDDLSLGKCLRTLSPVFKLQTQQDGVVDTVQLWPWSSVRGFQP